MLNTEMNVSLLSKDDKISKKTKETIESLSHCFIVNSHNSRNFLEHQKNESLPVFQIFLFDLDNCCDSVKEFLDELHRKNFLNVVTAAFSRKENPEKMDEFFINGGNIFFVFPKKQCGVKDILFKLMKVSYKIKTSPVNREFLIFKLN